jgi:hypothetical protein
MSENALYYPYIHIRDVDWLKSTLLLFGGVRRMLPFNRLPDDDAAIRPFTQMHGGREPLLQGANLFSPRAQRAQEELARKLRRDAQKHAFRKRFGRAAALQQRLPQDPYGFQIHQGKLHPDLKDALRGTGLAWEPGNLEPYDYGVEYVELHQRVGQAVMATLAVACAKGEGLDIVADPSSEGLHHCLAEQNADAVYDAWLGQEDHLADPRQPDARELFEFMVKIVCDVRDLDAEKLASMGADREPIRRLMAQLGEHAKAIDPMDPGPRRTEQIKDGVRDILEAWRQDRANMSHFWRKFFGTGLADAGTKFAEKAADKVLTPSPAVGGVATGSLMIGGYALSGLAGAGAGLAIGVAAHGVKSFAAMRKEANESRYRYLTTMERAGVVFRSDFTSL